MVEKQKMEGGGEYKVAQQVIETRDVIQAPDGVVLDANAALALLLTQVGELHRALVGVKK